MSAFNPSNFARFLVETLILSRRAGSFALKIVFSNLGANSLINLVPMRNLEPSPILCALAVGFPNMKSYSYTTFLFYFSFITWLEVSSRTWSTSVSTLFILFWQSFNFGDSSRPAALRYNSFLCLRKIFISVTDSGDTSKIRFSILSTFLFTLDTLSYESSSTLRTCTSSIISSLTIATSTGTFCFKDNMLRMGERLVCLRMEFTLVVSFLRRDGGRDIEIVRTEPVFLLCANVACFSSSVYDKNESFLV